MAKNKKAVDPLPQSFNPIAEFVEFWDKHSTADYPEAFRQVEEPVRLLERRHYRVALNARVGKKLAEQARTKGITLDKLVNQVLREHLQHGTQGTRT